MFKKEKKNDAMPRLKNEVKCLKKANERHLDRLQRLEYFQDQAIDKIEELNARLMVLEAGKSPSVPKANITVEDAMNVLSTFCGKYKTCRDCRFCINTVVNDQYDCYLKNNMPETW